MSAIVDYGPAWTLLLLAIVVALFWLGWRTEREIEDEREEPGRPYDWETDE